MNDNVIHVLSIEDNLCDALLIQDKLDEAQRVGWNLPRFEIEHVARLQAALARLDDAAFDVVLSDLDLPDSRAGETVATLREHIPRMPIVVLTGREDEALARKSVRAGVQDYLYKEEATGSLLARTMMYAIERQQAHDRLEQRVEERTAELRQANEELQAEIAERKRTEEALRASEGKYRALLQIIQAGIVVHGADSQVVTCNVKAQELLGLTEGQIVGKEATDPAWRFLREDGTPMPLEEYPVNQVLNTGRPLRNLIVGAVRPGENDVVWNTVSADPTFDAAGEVKEVIVSFMDVTERKQIEQALLALSQSLRTIVDALPQLVAYTDKDLTYRFVNQTYQEKFGVAPEDVIGKSLPEVIGEEAFKEAQPHVEKVLQGEQVRYHERYDYALGGTRDVDGILVPDIAADGEVRGYYAVLTDITPYMEMQKELRQYTGRLRIQHEIDAAILRAQSPQEIAIAALERLCHLIPCRHASVTEIDPTQQQGRDMIVLTDGEVQTETLDWHPLSRAGEQLLEDIHQGQTHLVGDVAGLETPSPLEEALGAAGLRSYVSVPLMVQDTPPGTLNLASETPDFFRPDHVEILEEVAASLAVALQQAQLLEQTKQDAEAKALLLREVNHRVKNNLDAIIGLLYVERRHAPPEALPAYRSIVEDLTQRITGLAEAHRMLSEAEWAPLNLSELTEQIIQTTVRGAGSFMDDGVDVTLDVAPASVYVQPAQAHHLALILSELTTNTLKHAAADRAAVHVEVQITQKDGMITLAYRNDGPDYPEDVLRLERHNTGLDIVRQSVHKSLRGELTLRNADGAVVEIRFEAGGRE